MKSILHKASERGHANHGWLNAWHSFSFAGFYNAQKVQFGALRVLNDDTISGGYGFPMHPHENMEIVTIPLQGALEHKDSTGRHEMIRTNDVQIMSAGKGIMHSEMNPGKETTNLLQIWVFPKQQNIEPRYQQKTYLPQQRENTIQTVVAPDANDSALWINQDAWFSLGKLDKGLAQTYQVKKEGNGVYVFVIEGAVQINGQQLGKRDALGVWDTSQFTVEAVSSAELLLIDVPMQLS